MMSEVPPGGTKRRLQDDSVHKPSKRCKEDNKTVSPPELNREEVFHDSSWLYEDCSYCNVHMKSLLAARFHGEKLVLQMHAQYSVFSKSSRGDSASKEDVRIFKDEFLQKVCSLRNERGGLLIIHVTGKSPDKGPSLDDFDQKVGEELSRMVEDDTLYVENYDRRWYSETSREHSQMLYLDYIIVTVKGSSSVSTKDFNTLVTWDGSKERPKAREVSRLLWRMSLQPCFHNDKSADCNFIEGDRINLYESRDVQLKRLYDKDLEKDLQDHPFLADKSLAYRIAFRLKEKLHLLEYITSFTKLRTGGSFFCGIEEEKQKVVVVTEKSKSSKKSKKKKKKGHGQKAEGEEEKEDVCDPMENTPQPVDVLVPGNENTEAVSSSSDMLRTGSKSDAAHKSITKSVQEREPVNKINSFTNQMNEQCLLSNIQTFPSVPSVALLDLKESSGDAVPCRPQFQGAHRLSACMKHLVNVENINIVNGSNGTVSQKSEEVDLTASVKVEPPVKVEPSSVKVDTLSVKVDSPGQAAGSDVRPDLSVHSESKDYKTAHNMVKGFTLTSQDRAELKEEIVKSVQKDMLWLRTDGSRLTSDEICDEIEVRFHCTSEANDTYVTEVWVKKVFGGIVFYRSYGPDAFRLTGLAEKKPRVVRMDPSEWIRLLRKSMLCDNCEKPIWKLQPQDEVNFS